MESDGERDAERGVGTLFVVATPIGNLGDVSTRSRVVLADVAVIAAEDTRRTGLLLKHLAVDTKMISYHEHNEAKRTQELLARLDSGDDVALVTDAGTPTVSDPGFRLIRAAGDAGLSVVAVPGASAVVAALSVAGLDADTFTFLGFLPRKSGQRERVIGEIAASRHATVLFESPQRILRTLQELVTGLGEDREVAVCRELTKVHEEVVRGRVEDVRAVFEQRPSVKGEITIVISKPADRRRPKRKPSKSKGS